MLSCSRVHCWLAYCDHIIDAMAALKMQASQYLSGPSNCSIPGITSPVVWQGEMRVGKGKDYNRACAYVTLASNLKQECKIHSNCMPHNVIIHTMTNESNDTWKTVKGYLLETACDV